MQNKPRENKLENDSPIQININISAGNGRINGAREFADLLCSKRLRVTGYRIRFTQKRNDKKTVLVEANYRTIGTIDIMKGFVFVSSVDGSKKVMYGSPDREFPDSEQVLSVMFHDVFGINTEIARVENGVLNTSDIELAQRIVNFYSDFVERMVAPVDYIDENGNRKNLVEKIRTGIVRIGEEGFIKIRVGRLAINRGAKGSFVTAVWPYGVKMDNGDYIQYDDMDVSDLGKIVACIESDRFCAAFNCQRGSIDGSLIRCTIDYKPCKGFMCENFLKG